MPGSVLSQSASPQRNADIEQPANENTPLLPGTEAVVSPVAAKATRLLYLDHIRGLLMVHQSIDHSRIFLSSIVIHHEEWWNMPDFKGSLYHWFLMHKLLEGFMMTMGMSIILFTMSRARMGWTWFSILKHFFIRGAVLVAFNFLMLPSGFGVVTTVLFALGVNIFIGACIVALESVSTAKITTLSARSRAASEAARLATTISIGCYVLAAMILSPMASWYTPSPAHQDDNVNWFFRFAFLPHKIMESDSVKLYSMYAPVPWMPFVLWGIALQRTVTTYKLRPKDTGLLHLALGTLMWIVFIPMRLAEGFGNINPEALHPSPRHSFINFFNLTKYPPSLAYTLCMLGIVHLLCALFILCEIKLKNSVWTSERNPLIVFGRSAFFFYILHFYVFRAFRWVLTLTGDIDQSNGGGFMDQTGNLSDPAYWVSWVVGLVLLYYMCERYAKFKAGTAAESIWRFF
ncbi:hypothetical protein PhCBS80983_g01975 [Powellomyces hirtus]|uniref:Heparan-alpha-glucosaminide N-acetyltransferase catalytic domain-containing protein n=1 Tax=Powellomyces hirtus TaxID=109895 RepID=A0A507E872_9FUNG|nr:hypothetical protein PhCBS80983_g01975 [Powellomyces hirtus]